MPRGSGRWSRAGASTGRRAVFWHRRLSPTEDQIVERIDMAAEIAGISKDMKKVIDRAKKLGVDVRPAKHHGAALLVFPGEESKPVYVPKQAAYGTFTTLMNTLDRYERGERAGKVTPDAAQETEETPTVSTTPEFDFDALATAWYEKDERIATLLEEAVEKDKLITELQNEVDDLTRQKAEMAENVMSEADRKLLETAQAFMTAVRGES